MKKDHGAFYNINLILIINLLERKQILKLIANIKGGENEEKKKNVCDAEVQTDAFFTPVNYQPITDDDIVVVDSGLPIPLPIMMSNTPVNAQIEEFRRFLGQISDESGSVAFNDEAMDISDENPTVTVIENIGNVQGFDLQMPSDFELEEAIPMSTPKVNKLKKVKKSL